MGMLTLAAAVWLAAGIGGPSGPAPDRLYGRVVTAAGQVFEGYLRWDRNEGSWADVLNGSKEMPWENVRVAEELGAPVERGRGRSLRFLGLRISWGEGRGSYPVATTSGIRFGHLRSLAVLGDDRALLTMKSGEEVVLEGGSTDLGDELRGLVVDDPVRGTVELDWMDLDLVDFMEAPGQDFAPEGRRLYGRLQVRGGEAFTGYVAWDVDEILTTDVLDGSEDGQALEIPFGRIAAIERAGADGARVLLWNGEELLLRGTNDVDSGNRGIAIADPGLGEVQVPWEDFEELRFLDAPEEGGGYARFDGGHPLAGTVETLDGEYFSGAIRWDNDEESSWEILDGRDGGVDFDVEFGQVRSVRRDGLRGCEVELVDGRTLRLEGSNDVDGGNKGIFVTLDGGETVLVPWRDFAVATFIHP